MACKSTQPIGCRVLQWNYRARRSVSNPGYVVLVSIIYGVCVCVCSVCVYVVCVCVYAHCHNRRQEASLASDEQIKTSYMANLKNIYSKLKKMFATN